MIQWNNTYQLQPPIHEARISMHTQYNGGALQTSLIAIADTALGVTAIVATIGEAVFKGLGNIFGAAFSNRFQFALGIQQLKSDVLFNLAALCCTPLFSTASVIYVAYSLTYNKKFNSQYIRIQENALVKVKTL
jgi:hypothetical protein